MRAMMCIEDADAIFDAPYAGKACGYLAIEQNLGREKLIRSTQAIEKIEFIVKKHLPDFFLCLVESYLLKVKCKSNILGRSLYDLNDSLWRGPGRKPHAVVIRISMEIRPNPTKLSIYGN